MKNKNKKLVWIFRFNRIRRIPSKSIDTFFFGITFLAQIAWPIQAHLGELN